MMHIFTYLCHYSVLAQKSSLLFPASHRLRQLAKLSLRAQLASAGRKKILTFETVRTPPKITRLYII